MKKIAISLAVAGLLISSASAESKLYIGYEQGSGFGERTYTNGNAATSVNIYSEEKSFKIGKQQDNFNKWEFEYGQQTLSNALDSSDKNEITTYKVNTIISLLSISYEDIVIPYFEVGVGLSSNDIHDGGLATHLGLGIMYNATENIQLNVKYKTNTNIGSTFLDGYSGMQFGMAYIFWDCKQFCVN